jgi:hypothetical protein
MPLSIAEAVEAVKSDLCLDVRIKGRAAVDAALASLQLEPCSARLKTNLHAVCLELGIETGWGDMGGLARGGEGGAVRVIPARGWRTLEERKTCEAACVPIQAAVRGRRGRRHTRAVRKQESTRRHIAMEILSTEHTYNGCIGALCLLEEQLRFRASVGTAAAAGPQQQAARSSSVWQARQSASTHTLDVKEQVDGFPVQQRCDTIFGNVAELKQLSDSLLEALEARVGADGGGFEAVRNLAGGARGFRGDMVGIMRVRVGIMGPGKYENVGKSRSVLIMINPVIFTRSRMVV